MNISDGSVEQGYDIKDSAYVQNLAELCHIVTHDLRWRVHRKSTLSDPLQTESLRLFSADYGDHMDAIWAFQQLYNNNLIRSTEQPTSPNIYLGRCMHLYARMFHRKGPWFKIDDLFLRYYFNKHTNLNSIEAETCTLENTDHTTSLGEYNTIDESLLHESIQSFFFDIQQLLQMGLIRTFQSEKECACVIDDTSRNGHGILKQSDVSKVKQRLGMGSTAQRYSSKSKGGGSKPTAQKQGSEQSILKYLSGQRTLSFSSTASSSNSTTSSFIPVIQHVNALILDNLCQKVSTKVSSEKREQAELKTESPVNIINVPRLSNMWHQSFDLQHTQGVLKDSSAKSVPLFTCIRLKEEPLLTLRRVSRLLLCAGSGPGAMRWDGTNAWTSVDDTPQSPRELEIVPKTPSTAHWHNVEFPGLKHRLGLQDSPFYTNYKPYLSSDFQSSKDSSILLERSNEDTGADYIQRLAYLQVFHSYQAFKAWEQCVDIRCWVDFLLETKGGCNTLPEKFYLHSKEKREKLIHSFQLSLGPSSAADRLWSSIMTESESIISSLSSLPANGADAEDIICYMGIICNYIFLFQLEGIKDDEMMALIARPWLRHMTWQSVLAYVLWNCVEIFEKKGLYHIAIWILESILVGRATAPSSATIDDISLRSSKQAHPSATKQGYVQFLLSRRVRGKAFDRLQVDRGHVDRKSKKKGETVTTDHSMDFQCLGSCGSIPFSYLRKLSRRMKVSITAALGNAWNIEVMELGIRLEHESSVSALVSKAEVTTSNKKKLNNCHGWTPITDFSVANSLTNNTADNVRKRCTYIGRESNATYDSHSLNVEELAMEEYLLGILPAKGSDNSIPVGGWKGWHDEGGFLKLLFRLLCTESLLACDVQDGDSDVLSNRAYELATIHLSPYQSAPLDLHVAHSFYYTNSSPENALPARSFYERRKSDIELFLNYLDHLSPQEISDLVHESVECNSIRSHPSSPAADSARQVVHTCSAIAAGFGGRALASIFRSLCFDFRHYNAGLPDLLLLRANYESDSDPIDLGEWLGEGFSVDDKSLSFALDTINTSDFLGCSEKDMKLKGNGPSLRGNSGPSTKSKEKLQFVHNGKKVQVKCIVVEVKSNNDSLDERQEDWLNIIDRAIPFHARVCKFTDSE